jgi:hypothetical protein
MTTAHGHLALHLSRHEYKRGANKGEAPADASRRARDHFRVAKHGDNYVVIFHHTRILRAYPDGSYVLDTSGWHASPTTREAMSLALGLIRVRGYLHTERRGTRAQTALRHLTTDKHLCYYDGMKFGPDHTLLTERKPFTREQVDRARTKEFRVAAKPFRETLPLLHATAPTGYRLDTTPEERAAIARAGLRNWSHMPPYDLRTAIQTPELWPLTVRLFYCETPAKTWAHIYRIASADLTELVPEPL